VICRRTGMQRMRPFETQEDLNTVRILVAGDAAVGKTRLCELICSGTCLGTGRQVEIPVLRDASHGGPQQEWTCGCSLSLTRETVDVDFRSVEVEVELWEVGGNKNYSCARPVFYDSIDAVVLVYDVSNMKSYHGLVAWLFELCSSVQPPSLKYWDTGGGSGGEPDVDLERAEIGALQQDILSGDCAVLFVANKCDLQEKHKLEAFAKSKPRPSPPEKPPIIDRLLGGGSGDAFLQGYRRSPAEWQLLDKLCDFVLRGRHTEASCRDGKLHFDFNVWKAFVRQVFLVKQRAAPKR